MSLPKDFAGISVVIPCRNEEKYIERCIRSIIDGTAPDISLEIIVVDGQSSDKTLEIIGRMKLEFPCIKIIENPRIETQFALNLGVKNASGTHVMIAGAHSEFPSSYIEILLNQMVELNADGVGGALKTDVLNKNRVSAAIMRILSHPAGVGNSKFRTGVSKPERVDTVPFGIYKKELFDEVGYYNALLKRNHDMEWSKRLIRSGKSIWLIPDVRCTYYARETYKTLASNNYMNGLWNILAVFITKSFRSLSLRHFIPFGFVASLIFSAVAGMFYLPALFIAVIIATIYLVSMSFFSIKLAGKDTRFYDVLWGFIVLHFSYGTGSIIGFICSFPWLFRNPNKKMDQK
jgi:glycosyltransferase involved in cell wall biosynthesis